MHEHASYTNTPHRMHPWKLTRTGEFVRVCQCGLGCMPTTRTVCVSAAQNTHTLTHHMCVSAAQNMPAQAHTHGKWDLSHLSPHLSTYLTHGISLSRARSLSLPPPSLSPLYRSTYLATHAHAHSGTHMRTSSTHGCSVSRALAAGHLAAEVQFEHQSRSSKHTLSPAF
jgi:hypothetical protein